MLLSNLESVPAHTILRQIDVVYGSTVRSKHVGRDFMAGLKNIVGGELTAYTELLEESRQEAMNRMISKAQSIGANAVVTKSIPPNSIAVGIPAKVRERKREEPKHLVDPDKYFDPGSYVI